MRRVAIVGGGPRALWAVEALLGHARRLGATVAVDVWDPAPPGHGAAYDPGQPEFLRLNVRSSIVHAGRRPLDDWRREHGETEPLDPFPPRALVGRYLSDVWAESLAGVPDGCALNHVPRAASADVVRGGGYDEVLLVPGHARDWPGALHHDWPADAAPLVPRVFPVSGLDESAVPVGSRVAVRGAALTFIDAALTLTAGRGGRFTGDASRPTYVPSGREPAAILPYTRAGRWMEAKPQPGSATERLDLDALAEEGRSGVTRAASGAGAVEEVRRSAHAYLTASGGDDHDELDAVFDGVPTGDATEALRRSLAVATGAAAPTGAWAVGRAWRDLYPALAVRFGGLGPDFTPFADAARRLERVAFGPPPVNAAKILALVDAGVIPSDAPFTERPEADVVVDAVLPPPGLEPGRFTLPGVLAEAGILTRAPHDRRGVAIDPDGTCLDAAGRRIEGLSAAGRCTEDVTIGNDTLGRTLQPTIDRWAARVARTLEEDR